MNGDRPSVPARWQSLSHSVVREYRDDALLGRVRHRLTATVAGPARPQRSWQVAAAVLLFGLGVGVGYGLPSSDANSTAGPELTRATAESTRTGTTTAPRARSAEERATEVRPPPRRTAAKRVALAAARSPDPTIDLVQAPLEADVIDPATTSSTTAPASDRRTAWLELAETGDYVGALAELERSQVAHVVLATGSVEELMTMAEVARFAGNQERAVQALSQVVDRYGGDPNAPLAAMMLGNLLSRSGDSAGAARAFALNRRLSPGGDFAEDALAREFDLVLAAEDAELASRLYDQYAREFPAGPRIYAMRYELDELVAAGAEPGSGPADADRQEGARPDAARPDGQHGDGQQGETPDDPPEGHDKN